MDFILGVGVAVLLLAALIAWSSWIYRLDREADVERFDAHVAREGGPWVGREQAVARVPVDPKMLGEGSGDDWMLECNGCGQRMPPFEPLRGEGYEGLSVARAIASDEGWTSEPESDFDLCPKCRA